MHGEKAMAEGQKSKRRNTGRGVSSDEKSQTAKKKKPRRRFGKLSGQSKSASGATKSGSKNSPAGSDKKKKYVKAQSNSVKPGKKHRPSRGKSK